MLTRLAALAPFLFALLSAQSPTVTTPDLARTRAVWFVDGENPIGAEVGFAYERVAITDAGKAWTDAKPGTRIGLGAATWAALETFTDLKFGGVAVKAGNYYVVLERGKDGWLLGLLDAEKVRAAQLPPGPAKGQPLVVAIPLVASERADAALQATWEPAAQADAITLALGVGSHVLRATASVKGSGNQPPNVFPDERGASRLAFGASDGAKVPFAVIDHGKVAWSAAVAEQAKAMAIGKRWRLGKDWATTLDTNVPLLLGGKKVAAGSWHLTLGRTKDGWNLVLSPAEADHRARIDGFAADLARAVVEVPLQTTAAPAATNVLQVGFATSAGKHELVIAFGQQRRSVSLAPGK